jgi:hypothetical protein
MVCMRMVTIRNIDILSVQIKKLNIIVVDEKWCMFIGYHTYHKSMED